MNAKMRVLMEKEWWTLKENSWFLRGIGLILFIIALPALVPPTPQTSYTAHHQILSNPKLFGLNTGLVDLLSDQTDKFWVLVMANPLTIGILTYMLTYSYLSSTFFSEKTNKTMEVLFSAPVSEMEIVASKMAVGALFGLVLVFFAFIANTLAIEVLFYHYTGLLWAPTPVYLSLMVIFPLAFLSLALPFALVLGLRSSKATMALGSVVVFIPIILLILASQVPAGEYFQLIIWIAVASVLLAVLIVLVSRRMVNRLAFITN